MKNPRRRRREARTWRAMTASATQRAFPTAQVRPRKENAPCCVARRDELGRLPIGFCSPDCVRRPPGNPRHPSHGTG